MTSMAKCYCQDSLTRTCTPPGEDSLVSRPTVPETPDYWPLFLPILDVQAADLASPLEEELLKLQSDLEKARDSVREDFEFTF